MAKKKKPAGGNAIIYARYSSHNQRDVSIEQQIEACRKHAAELGLTITDTYEDRAISGRTDNRPAFQRMMRDAEDGKFQYVLAWKSNRMGRNMMQAMVNESRLMDCGVKVFYAEEDFDDSARWAFCLLQYDERQPVLLGQLGRRCAPWPDGQRQQVHGEWPAAAGLQAWRRWQGCC